MSMEGASTTHSRGINTSTGFLDSLKLLAVEELQAHKQQVLSELMALGVDPEA